MFLFCVLFCLRGNKVGFGSYGFTLLQILAHVLYNLKPTKGAIVSNEKLGSAHIEDEDLLEMHKTRLKFFKERGFSSSETMAFLSSEIIWTLATAGYGDEFVKYLFEKMYIKFLNHPMRKRN